MAFLQINDRAAAAAEDTRPGSDQSSDSLKQIELPRYPKVKETSASTHSAAFSEFEVRGDQQYLYDKAASLSVGKGTAVEITAEQTVDGKVLQHQLGPVPANEEASYRPLVGYVGVTRDIQGQDKYVIGMYRSFPGRFTVRVGEQRFELRSEDTQTTEGAPGQKLSSRFRTITVPTNKLPEDLPFQVDAAMRDVLTHSPQGVYRGKQGNYRDQQGDPLSPSTVTHETAHKVNGWITRTHGKKWPNPETHGGLTYNQVEGLHLRNGVGTVVKAPRVPLSTIRDQAVLAGPHSDLYMSRQSPRYTSAYPLDELAASLPDVECMLEQRKIWFAENRKQVPDIDNLGGRIIDVLNLLMGIEQNPDWYRTEQDRQHALAVIKYLLERAIPLYEQGVKVLKPKHNWMDAVSRTPQLTGSMQRVFGPQWFSRLRKGQTQ